MTDQVFHFFPHLDEYLRRMIWKFYFTAPRIHVIHESARPLDGSEVVHLACTTFDAESNIPVPSYLHWDIDRESRQVAQGLKPKRERIENLLRPIKTGTILSEAPQVEPPETPVGKVAPVDIDWENDWIYIYSPDSVLPSLSLRVREDWVAKITKLAICEPMVINTPIYHRNIPNIPGNLEDIRDGYFPRLTSSLLHRLMALQEIEVVICTDNVSSIAKSDPNGEEGGWCEQLPRNSVGFVSWHDYEKVNKRVEARRYGLGSPAMLSVHRKYENSWRHDRGKKSALGMSVDIDGWQLGDRSYHRRRRGGLPAPPEPIIVDGEEFTIEVTEPC